MLRSIRFELQKDSLKTKYLQIFQPLMLLKYQPQRRPSYMLHFTFNVFEPSRFSKLSVSY